MPRWTSAIGRMTSSTSGACASPIATRPVTLRTRETTLLNPKARTGITRDSMIVTATFFTHTLARVFAESFYLAREGFADPWQPVASALARLWSVKPDAQFASAAH